MRLFAACLLLETMKQKNRAYVTVQLSFYPLYTCTCREAGKCLTVSWDSWLIHSLFPIFFLNTASSSALRVRDTGFLARLYCMTGEQMGWIIVFMYCSLFCVLHMIIDYNKLPVTALLVQKYYYITETGLRVGVWIFDVRIIEVGLYWQHQSTVKLQ